MRDRDLYRITKRGKKYLLEIKEWNRGDFKFVALIPEGQVGEKLQEVMRKRMAVTQVKRGKTRRAGVLKGR